MFRLVLLRHGQTDWNAQDRYQGRSDIPLNATGIEQAEAAGQRWKDTEFTRAVASPLMRARRTAEIVATQHPGLSLTTDERLMETTGGQWEALSFPEIIEKWPDEYRAFRLPDIDAGPVGGESPRQSGQRSSGAMLEYVEALAGNGGAADAENEIEQNLLIVAHGNTIRAATQLLLGLDDSEYAKIPRLENCRAHVLISTTGRPGEWQPEHFNY